MKALLRTTPLIASADLIVDPPVAANVGDQIEFGCRLVEDYGPTRRIWFRFPRDYAPVLSQRADPFVIATLNYAMGRVRRLRVHGAVSEGLFANLTEFQTAFSAFHHQPLPDVVEFSATETAEPIVRSRHPIGITAFSGGVDGSFSIYRHTGLSSLTPKRPIRAALMMHGFDIPLEQPEVFRTAAERARLMTDDAGLQFYTGATNLRTIPMSWTDTFATAVAASLAFFQPACAFGLVPSFQDWTHVRFDHGSNPLTDPLLSSPSFQIIHDGAGFGRIDKLRHLANWPAALRHLRVCWQGDQLDRNCGRCEKCVRTMLMLRICGVREPGAFPRELDVGQLDDLVINSQAGLDEFSYLLEEARRIGLDEPWMKPTARALRRNRRNLRLWHRGKSVAEIVPPRVRQVLRKAGYRWLLKAPAPAAGTSVAPHVAAR